MPKGPLSGLTHLERRMRHVYPDQTCQVCGATYTPRSGRAKRCASCIAADPFWKRQPHPRPSQ